MRFLVITNAPTLKKEELYYAYSPYVNEMDIWFKYATSIYILSPTKYDQNLLISSFKKQPYVISLPRLDFRTFYSVFGSLIRIPIIVLRIFVACYKADHIHLRCPGNIGLLGCLVQVFFPKKFKTAKYAGNWDPKSKQPLSYRFQKWILSNTVLTKNMKVLVYGDWKNQTLNIKPFFTATFRKSEIEIIEDKTYSNILNFVFIGSLVKGKRPLLVIKIIEELAKQGKEVYLDLYGDGILKEDLEEYILENNLSKFVKLHGNQSKEVVQRAIKKAHFSILPSKSEGWPKAIAESMFYGAIPIATRISCIPYMLDYGKRGILIEPILDKAVIKIVNTIMNHDVIKNMARDAKVWSQHYTLDLFEEEISNLIKNN